MKNLLHITLLFLCFGMFNSFKTAKTSCPAIQSEGIYVFKIDAENSAVIRFYTDKTVLVSTSINDYKEVMTWFNREPENFARVLTGKYKVSKSSCTVSFKVKGETGVQQFFGKINDDKTITFEITNPAQNKKARVGTTRAYTFVKM